MNKKLLIIISSLLVVTVTSVILAVTIFNKKEPITYNVSFETNGGTKINIQVVNEGEMVVKPSDPIKEGHVFVQWTYQGKTYDFSLPVQSDLVLTAKWEEKIKDVETFVVKFNSDGGTTIPNQQITKGNKITKPTEPIKEGYTFKGWFLNDVEYNFNLTIEKDLELSARWEKIEEKVEKPQNNVSNNNSANNNNNQPSNNTAPVQPTIKKHTVTFNSNGGSDVASQTIEEGKKIIQPANPSRIGYVFTGWSLNGNAYNFNEPITGNVILSANWVLYGDVNKDGNIDSTDLVYISQYIVGKMELDSIQMLVSDVNLDRIINEIDTDILSKYISDKEGYGIDKLPHTS